MELLKVVFILTHFVARTKEIVFSSVSITVIVQ